MTSERQVKDMERLVFPLGCLLKREGDQWASLCPELDVASCGQTLEEAKQALKDAVETYILFMLEEGLRDEIPRPVSQADIQEFLTDPPGDHVYECQVLVVTIVEGAAEPTVEFLEPELCPVPVCAHRAAA